jgi:hypothetical protein
MRTNGATTRRSVSRFQQRGNEIFERNLRWIGRNGPVVWPVRSPDLNPLNFFLLCGMKSRVYHTGKPEERHQQVEATHELTLVSATNWHACSGNIKWHKDWQQAYSVMAVFTRTGSKQAVWWRYSQGLAASIQCDGGIHKDWQQAYSVVATIQNLFYNNLEISLLL